MVNYGQKSPMLSDFRALLTVRKQRFKQHPILQTFFYILKAPVVFYCGYMVSPFVTDFPYLTVFLLTISPFILIRPLRLLAFKTITTTLVVVTLSYFYISKPIFFPANPDSLLFSASFFRFENYNEQEQDKYPIDEKRSFFLAEINKIFPLGTKKEYVEDILTQQGGAVKSVHEGKTVYSYKGLWSWNIFTTASWIVQITYDDENTVSSITARYGLTSF